MPQLIGLEWDSREVRMMVASGRGRQVVIEQAFSFPIESDVPAVGLAEKIGRRVAGELDARGLGRSDAVVAVGRSSIELRQLQLPPAAEDDLPDLVRFQAMREFNEFDDRWQLDYLPIEGSAENSRTVLATAIGPAAFEQCKAVCGDAGLKLRRMLLRPCEAALLLTTERAVPRGRLALLVNLLEAEAELTAVVNGAAVFLHTARISGDAPPSQSLLAAIRLTMAAVPNQLGGRKIESIVICGAEPSHVELARAIETELGIRAELFDPFQHVQRGRRLAETPPEHPGRFAALAGMLLAELRPSDHAVDFLSPRRRAEKPDPRKKWVIAGAAAAVLLLGWFIVSRTGHYLLSSRVAKLTQQSRDLEKSLDDARRAHLKVADAIRWADEERQLARSVLRAQSMFSAGREGYAGRGDRQQRTTRRRDQPAWLGRAT